MVGAAILHQTRKFTADFTAPHPVTLPSDHHMSRTVTVPPTQHEALACNYKEMVSCPVRSLFQNSEIHRLTTKPYKSLFGWVSKRLMLNSRCEPPGWQKSSSRCSSLQGKKTQCWICWHCLVTH